MIYQNPNGSLLMRGLQKIFRAAKDFQPKLRDHTELVHPGNVHQMKRKPE